MIAFKEFQKAPKLGGLLSGPLETAVAAANEWINATAVQVINVETDARSVLRCRSRFADATCTEDRSRTEKQPGARAPRTGRKAD